MLTEFCKSLTIVARKGTPTVEIYTAPHPVGDATFLDATLLAAVLFTQNPGVPTLAVTAQGSHDGTNWFVLPVAFSVTTPGFSEDSDYITCVLLRFKLSLSTNAALDDNLAVATIDLYANLTRK